MLEGTGLKPKHYKEPEAEVWPEAWPALDLFQRRLSTQWRCHGGGPIGLDYSIVYTELAHAGIQGAERDEFMDVLAIVEAAALRQIHKE
ncbi:DUF1799 domain-containing protein [Xanthomonas translucens pv. translucens]|uniref:DUF1799 domain-containing protein n=1 Tax=Xanthomonas campestris pv. translucens TaxID=343 RepID=UPI003F72113A